MRFRLGGGVVRRLSGCREVVVVRLERGRKQFGECHDLAAFYGSLEVCRLELYVLSDMPAEHSLNNVSGALQESRELPFSIPR
jgi:hypothetical protein